MPVLYEGATSPPPPSPLPLLLDPRPHHRRTGVAIPSPSPLTWLCIFATLSALLILHRTTSARKRRPAQTQTQTTQLRLPFAAEKIVARTHWGDWPRPRDADDDDSRSGTESLAASYYDTQNDLGMDPRSTSTTSSSTSTSAAATTTTTSSPPTAVLTTRPQENTEWAPQELDAGQTNGSGGSLEAAPPRRRSYTKIKSIEGGEGEDIVQLSVQGEIVVAEGWRRHTRVYGGGVCLACAESERRGKMMGA